MANAAVNDIIHGESQSELRLGDPLILPSWDDSKVSDSDEEVVISHNWDELRRTLWDYVGIVRTNKRLQRALRRIDLLKDEVREYYANFKLSANLIELRNLVTVAELIVRSALVRDESRGGHYCCDYPLTNPEVKHTILFLKDNIDEIRYY
jgi:L-aspartate oxidase